MLSIVMLLSNEYSNLPFYFMEKYLSSFTTVLNVNSTLLSSSHLIMRRNQADFSLVFIRGWFALCEKWKSD